MHQLRLAGFRVAPARLHAPRLEIAAVGAGGDFPVLVLARHPNFQIVGLGRAKAHVAGAQGQHAVRQFEPLQYLLGIGGQFLQRLVGLGRIDDPHHFHLVELVLADHAAGVAAGGAGLAAKARGMGDELQRQLPGVEDLAGHDVGQRYLGGGDQVEIGLALAADLEQILLKLGQLTGALQGRRLYQIRGVGFLVAVFAGVQVEHELRQRPVQPGDGAAHQGEAGAGELGGGLEVQPAMALAEGDVILDREIEGTRDSPAAHLHVVLFVGADRHRLVRQVGNAQHQGVQLGLDGVQLALAGLQIAAHAVDLGQQRRDVLAARLGLADGFGAGVALGLQLFGAGLHGLALGFEALETRHVQLEATGCQAAHNLLQLGTNQFGVEHGMFSSIDQSLVSIRPAQVASRPPSTLNAR